VVEMFSWVERERRVEWADLVVRKKGVMVVYCALRVGEFRDQ